MSKIVELFKKKGLHMWFQEEPENPDAVYYHLPLLDEEDNWIGD